MRRDDRRHGGAQVLLEVHLGGHVVLVDTVGFVSKLPPELVASFRSTLEELRFADLLLAVLDASHPDAVGHISEVRAIQATLDASRIPRLWLVNKVDLVDSERIAEIGSALDEDPYLPCSAVTGAGLEALVRAIRDRLSPV